VKTERRRLHVRPHRVNQLLGTEIETPEMLALLEPIGFRPLDAGGGVTETRRRALAGSPR